MVGKLAEQFTPWFTPFTGEATTELSPLTPSIDTLLSNQLEDPPNYSDLVSQWSTPYSEVLPEHTSPSGTAVTPEGDLNQKLVSTFLKPISGQTVDQRTQHAIINDRLRNLAVNNPLALTTYNPNSTVPDYKQGWGDPAMITGQDYAILGGRDSAQRSTAPDWWQRFMAGQYQGLQALRDTLRDPVAAHASPAIRDARDEAIKLNKEGVDTAYMRGVPSVEAYVNELEYQRNARNLVAKNLMGHRQLTDAQKESAPPQKTRVVDTGPSASDIRRINAARERSESLENRIRKESSKAKEAKLQADDKKAIARARANEARVIADSIKKANESKRLDQLNQQMLARMKAQEDARKFREKNMAGQYGFF